MRCDLCGKSNQTLRRVKVGTSPKSGRSMFTEICEQCREQKGMAHVASCSECRERSNEPPEVD